MSQLPKRYCVFGCDFLVTFCVPLHRFPHPTRKPELFNAWVSVVGDKLQETDRIKIYKSKRLCDHHFGPNDKISIDRIKPSAIPSVNLQRIQQGCTTFLQADHCYTRPPRESSQSIAMMDITNLPGPSRLINPEETLPTGSTETTCLTAPQTKFDADKTFEYLRQQNQTGRAKKIRQKDNEIRRLRLKVKSYKLRLRQLQINQRSNFEKLTQNMSESAKLFTRMQFQEGKKKKKGHRFTLEEKILSLSIFKKSPKAYKLMCKHFTLPSRKVLKSILAQIKLSPGINEIIFKELKNTVSKMLPQDRLCTLIFDEMSISPHLHYNVHTDDLVGFENYGDAEKTANFANHVLVFMVKGIKKNFKQPVAYYFTQALKTQKLKEIIKNVVSKVQATGLRILATVCDQSTVNTSTINSLISEAKSIFMKNGKDWRDDIIIINDQHIIPLFDVPHLLKGVRNNMLNKEMQYMHENHKKTVKWDHIQWVYQADKSHGELRILPKLTDEHIDPLKIKKMRVKNAAQVLSHSMAVATDSLAARGDIPSECRDLIPFVLLMDKLFDTFNASSFSAPNGKIYRAAVKRNSPHHQLWQEALIMLKTVKFLVEKSNGQKIEKSIPTINNFIRTIDGFKALWQLLLKKYSVDAMLTRNINQDPLENFFGCIRSLGARNIAPNCVGFEGAFKTLLLNNFSSNHAINSNCENDENNCLQSLSFFIKSKEKIATPLESQNVNIDLPLDLMQNTKSISDAGSDQRSYVCGWALSKCLQKIVKGCTKCKSKLLGNPGIGSNQFIRAKEYTKNKRWLCYPSNDLESCFREVQDTTVAYLNSECHKKNIKERIKAFIEIFVDFSFMECESHKDKLKEFFVDISVNLIIYSWCRSVNRILDGKITYEGEDATKTAAQLYYNKHKTTKKL